MARLAWWNLAMKITMVVIVWSLGNDLTKDLAWTWSDWQYWLVALCQGAVIVQVTNEYTHRSNFTD